MQDTLIPYTHSQDMNAVCPTVSFLHLVPEMDHNEFKLMEDLVTPFKQFVTRLDQGNKTNHLASPKPVELNIVQLEHVK